MKRNESSATKKGPVPSTIDWRQAYFNSLEEILVYELRRPPYELDLRQARMCTRRIMPIIISSKEKHRQKKDRE